MPLFCDVALPVPLDQTFTYAVNGVAPVVGARVLVPFSGQRLMGVVVKVHEDAPAEGFEVKPVQQVLDDAALTAKVTSALTAACRTSWSLLESSSANARPACW